MVSTIKWSIKGNETEVIEKEDGLNMTTKSKIMWLRISYWAAAIADFGIAILVLIPERVGLSEFEYPMGMTSVIAFSWGIMLLLANRKPLERRWVLIPTFIVVMLLTGVGIYAIMEGLVELNVPSLLVGFILMPVILFSYINSNRLTEIN